MCATPDCLGAVKAKGLCKPCYYRQWRTANADKIRETKRQEYVANKAVIIERSRQARLADPERHLEHQRAWRRRHAKPRVLLTDAEKRARKVIKQQRREARKRNAPINDFTLQQWQEVLAEHDNCCFYCKTDSVPLQQEHMTPLSRGGSHTKANIVPACGPCNSKKRDKTADEFLAVRAAA